MSVSKLIYNWGVEVINSGIIKGTQIPEEKHSLWPAKFAKFGLELKCTKQFRTICYQGPTTLN